MKNPIRPIVCLFLLSAALGANAHAASLPVVDPLIAPGILAVAGASIAALFTVPAHAAAVNAVPEIDPSLGPAALALLAGAVMVIRGRRRV